MRSGVGDLQVSARPLRVEAILQTFVVFLGANVAWLLLFDDVQEIDPQGT